ncbi:MAG: hypothetical protein DSY81_08680 [Bacillota bacterium]|nr:MAG: hypothetical protein DSY81_08680 [Bacillota bacterium]
MGAISLGNGLALSGEMVGRFGVAAAGTRGSLAVTLLRRGLDLCWLLVFRVSGPSTGSRSVGGWSRRELRRGTEAAGGAE